VKRAAAEQLANQLKALASPIRLMILAELHESPGLAVLELAQRVGVAQGTISHHLRILHEAALVRMEPMAARRAVHEQFLDRHGVNDLAAAIKALS
jgi:predicted transcriptional regulator